jgi:hypothetical protein
MNVTSHDQEGNGSQGRRVLMQKSLLYLVSVACLIGVAGSARLARADGPSLEARIHAAFVLNFIQFIEWPENAFSKPADPIIIALLPSDPIEGALATAIDGTTIKGRKLMIVHVSADQPIPACHVLIVGSENPAEAAAMIKSVAGQSIVTIGDCDDFTDAGGTIRFYTENQKERFEINLASAKRANVQVSAKLLKLAKIVNK